MLYLYMTLSDETLISHTQLLADSKVEVSFERPTETGFDTARCVLPQYKWLYNKGFSDDEITFFTKFLQTNAHLLIKYAKEGGINIA